MKACHCKFKQGNSDFVVCLSNKQFDQSQIWVDGGITMRTMENDLRSCGRGLSLSIYLALAFTEQTI